MIGFRDSPKANLRAIVGVGDVDNADHVMVHTPGMNSTVDKNIFGKNGNWGGGIRDMNNILHLSKKILTQSGKSNQNVAGVYNLNYNAPNWNDTLLTLTGLSYRMNMRNLVRKNSLNYVMAYKQRIMVILI